LTRKISKFTDVIGDHVTASPQLWIRLGNFETRFLADRIDNIEVEKPVYVTGLARAGTTITLELLAKAQSIASHHYHDFPFVFTPYWWNKTFKLMPKQPAQPIERLHSDGITVTANSPEAIEEVLWMAFFDYLHDPSRSNVLSSDTSNPEFEQFYTDHIKKLLLVNGGKRYIAKGNYNISRLAYLQKIHPDALFVILVRHPADHIASLIRQHRLFTEVETNNPLALKHMRKVGHFEFGKDLRPINFGYGEQTNEVLKLWASRQVIRGWARYWAQVYSHVDSVLRHNSKLRNATLVLSHQKLCDDPMGTYRDLFEHCQLTQTNEAHAIAATMLGRTKSYDIMFSSEDQKIISGETSKIASLFNV